MTTYIYNNHLSKTTNAEYAQANSHRIITVYDDQQSNATSDHFFVSQIKRNLSKTTTITTCYPAKKW